MSKLFYKGYVNIIKSEIKEMVNIITNNSFFMFACKEFRPIKGIQCSPFLADLYLSSFNLLKGIRAMKILTLLKQLEEYFR